MNTAEQLAPEREKDHLKMQQEGTHVAATLCRVANDINNLFAALNAQARLAQEDASGAEQEELVNMVLASAEKAQQVFSDAVKELPAEWADAAMAQAHRGCAPTQSSTRMLVVDDEESMRRVIGRMLERNGYRVTTAASGAEAMRLAAETAFDIAFVDLRLGDMSGLEVAGELRRRAPSTHIIFLSGDPMLDKLRDEKSSDSLAAFIKKPFDMQEVNELVSYILTMRAALAI